MKKTLIEELQEKKGKFKQDLETSSGEMEKISKKIIALNDFIEIAERNKRSILSPNAELIGLRRERDEIAATITEIDLKLCDCEKQITAIEKEKKDTAAELDNKRLPEICDKIDRLSRDLGAEYRAIQELIRIHGPRLRLYAPRVNTHGGCFPILPRFTVNPVASIMNTINDKNTFFIP
jgi:predicted  nucleic acid-binding Zn-ribbon protein